MMNRGETLLASVLFVLAPVVSTAEAQAPPATQPSTVDTRLGQLKYQDGYPTKETAQTGRQLWAM